MAPVGCSEKLKAFPRVATCHVALHYCGFERPMLYNTVILCEIFKINARFSTRIFTFVPCSYLFDDLQTVIFYPRFFEGFFEGLLAWLGLFYVFMFSEILFVLDCIYYGFSGHSFRIRRLFCDLFMPLLVIRRFYIHTEESKSAIT